MSEMKAIDEQIKLQHQLEELEMLLTVTREQRDTATRQFSEACTLVSEHSDTIKALESKLASMQNKTVLVRGRSIPIKELDK